MSEQTARRERFKCTKETPWRPEIGTPVEHADAEEIDWADYGFGVCKGRYKCPHCGTTFYAELAQ
jgi:hypothetical protein